MPVRSTRSRPPNTPNDQVVREYELIRPDGRWHRMRFPTRAERFRRAVSESFLLIISLALWALHLTPLIALVACAWR